MEKLWEGLKDKAKEILLGVESMPYTKAERLSAKVADNIIENEEFVELFNTEVLKVLD